MSNKKNTEKGDIPLRVYCNSDELRRIDDYRYKNRFPVRTKAILSLIELGLEYAELLERQKLVGALSPSIVMEDESR